MLRIRYVMFIISMVGGFCWSQFSSKPGYPQYAGAWCVRKGYPIPEIFPQLNVPLQVPYNPSESLKLVLIIIIMSNFGSKYRDSMEKLEMMSSAIYWREHPDPGCHLAPAIVHPTKNISGNSHDARAETRNP
ncbi:hypothetical protein Tco_0820429 [Tanacetum coccineum]|uniref:Uncharacterized protein n=1 Tax=Tanacetum coccineum TaxID=301880 RepID=A0ABQ5A9F1_9ASTR